MAEREIQKKQLNIPLVVFWEIWKARNSIGKTFSIENIINNIVFWMTPLMQTNTVDKGIFFPENLLHTYPTLLVILMEQHRVDHVVVERGFASIQVNSIRYTGLGKWHKWHKYEG